jgi:hypothetical protein
LPLSKEIDEMGEFHEVAKIIKLLPDDFGQALVKVMEWRDMTIATLAEKIEVDDKTISRARNNKETIRDPSKIVAMCVAMQLHPSLSHELLRLAGITLKKTGVDMVYLHIISTLRKSTIQECNKFLLSIDDKYPPLTKAG